MKIILKLALLFVALFSAVKGFAVSLQPKEMQPTKIETEQIQTKENIRIAVDEWPPYQSETARHYGSAHRIITEAFQHESVTVTYGWFPWARALSYAKQGRWDAAALSQRNKEREEYYLFSDPIFSVDKHFFHLKEVIFNWTSLDDLAGKIICAPIGYAFGDEFTRAESEGGIDVKRVATVEQCLLMLINKRVDLFPSERKAGYHVIRTQFPEEEGMISHHPRAIQTVSYHLIFSKALQKNVALMRRFNIGLANLAREGKIETYLEEGLNGLYEVNDQ